MGIQQFLELVVPDKGAKIIALATPTGRGNIWCKYKKYDSTKAAAAAAEFFDDNGETVYFAVNSFGDWYEDERKKKRRIRTQ